MKCLVGTDSWLKRADGSRVKVELLKGKEKEDTHYRVGKLFQSKWVNYVLQGIEFHGVRDRRVKNVLTVDCRVKGLFFI